MHDSTTLEPTYGESFSFLREVHNPTSMDPYQYHIQTHQEPTIFHVSHDPSCHENPPRNLPYDDLKHRRKNKYLATSLEVAHFEFGDYEYPHYYSSMLHVDIN